MFETKMLEEEKPFGHNYPKIIGWLNKNGFKYSGQPGKHPEFTHTETNYSMPGINPHKGDVNSSSVSNMIKIIKTHHSEHGFKYRPINESLTFGDLQNS